MFGDSVTTQYETASEKCPKDLTNCQCERLLLRRVHALHSHIPERANVVGYLGKLRQLSLFARSSAANLETFLDFLATNTLDAWSIDSLFVSIVRSNGGYFIAGGHGAQASLLINGFERHFDRNSPGAMAYFDGQIEECGSFDAYPFYARHNAVHAFPNGFQYSLAVPVPSYGPLMIYCQAAHDLDRESQNFLYALGETLASHLDLLGFRDQITNVGEGKTPFVMMALTPRQWEIHGLILEGMSNLAIAREMKYSESLIRQETMRIYKKLGISGRKDLPISRNALDVTEGFTLLSFENSRERHK